MIFVLGVSWGDVFISSAPLTPSTTGPALHVEEPFLRPLTTNEADIVSPFGKREVVTPSTGTISGTGQPKVEMHEGVDYAANPGTPVRAARSGRVIFAGFSKMYVSRTNKNDQHRFVIILHADGKSSRYVHLNGLRVRPGQDVKAGQALGVVAESDEWVAPVLHFEVRNIQGQPIDPEKVMTEVGNP